MSGDPDLARAVLDAFKARGAMLATAESCTGGLLAAALTDIAGSSVVLDCGFVTYSNAAKISMLGVAERTLAAHGAVSSQTAHEMALGALARSRATAAVSVTGIAGPDGGSVEKPVGLVWFSLAVANGWTRTERRVFENRGRFAIRQDATRTALGLLLEAARIIGSSPAIQDATVAPGRP